MFFVHTPICIFVLLVSAFAAEPQFAFPQPLAPPAFSLHFGNQGSINNQHFSLTGSVENNDGRVRLVLGNKSAREFRGICRISLGNDGDQKEVGQLELTLPAQEITLLQLSNVSPLGEQYTLAIYDRAGVRRFFKIAPLRPVSDPTPAVTVAVSPVQQTVAKRETPLLATGNPSPAVTAAKNAEEFAIATSQVQVQARLLANEEANDSFILSFEFRAQRPVNNATMAIVAGKIKNNKPVSINSQSHIEFKLPENLEAEHIAYTLTGKDGRVLAKGELDLQQLMTDGLITVSDIRTDRSSYESGDTARITMLFEGKSKHGYRLELSARDGQGQAFFRDQRMVEADDNTSSLELNVAIPSNASTPVVFEFKIFDSETGLLFDSGEREIPMSTAKPARRPEH